MKRTVNLKGRFSQWSSSDVFSHFFVCLKEVWMWCLILLRLFLQMSSGEILTHEGKLMCCIADSSWGDMNGETRFSSLVLAKINTYHSIKKKKQHNTIIFNVYRHQWPIFSECESPIFLAREFII